MDQNKEEGNVFVKPLQEPLALREGLQQEKEEVDSTYDSKPTQQDAILQHKDIINIMLIGQDRRPGQSRTRSDSMILATINKKDKTLKLTSFMRDLYVQIPGYKDNRMNAAYALGGMQLLDDTIAHNFKIKVDGNVEVDFDQFIMLVDKIGGIDITVSVQEAEYLGLSSEGLVHMDGGTALNYSRIRYIDNDYERTLRQRKVLEAAYSKVKVLNLVQALTLAKEAFSLVNTDLSDIEVINLASTVMNIGVQELGTYRIPIDGGYQADEIRDMQVLVPDLDKNRQALRQNLYGILPNVTESN